MQAGACNFSKLKPPTTAALMSKRRSVTQCKVSVLSCMVRGSLLKENLIRRDLKPAPSRGVEIHQCLIQASRPNGSGRTRRAVVANTQKATCIGTP